MPSKKIVFLGGGSTYFTGILGELATTTALEGSEITLYDIDNERAQLMAGCGQSLSDIAGAGLKVRAVKRLANAVDGADFAIANIGGIGGEGGGFHRTGGIHIKDVAISAKYGIYQVVGDTCGPAAMMAAFRTVPIYLDICRQMEKRCPNAVFINHANPMATLCRAVNKHTALKDTIGICHGVQGGIQYAAEILGVNPSELDTVWIGTNHYYWFTEIYHNGKDVYPKLKKKMARHKAPRESKMHADMCRMFGYQVVYPSDDHNIEFYPYLSQIKDGMDLPYEISKGHHGLEVIQAYGGKGRRLKKSRMTKVSRKVILDDYTKHLKKTVGDFKERLKQVEQEEFDDIEEKMASVEGVGSLIGAIATGRRKVHIVNIPNRGAVPNLPDTAVLEIEGATNSRGIQPIYIGEAPTALKGQLEKIIAWQELVADAAAKGDRQQAMQALMLDPMGILPDKAEAMLNELLANSKRFLPQFK